MKKSLPPLGALLLMLALFQGCQRSSQEVWEDTKTAVRYLNKGGKVWNVEQIEPLVERDFSGSIEEEFIPLDDSDLKTALLEQVIPQPQEKPGEAGSSVPSLDKFQTPLAEVARIFSNVYFNTDEHILRSKEHIDALARIADYMKRNQEVYITVEGHCDERGPEAYNLSLGTRRANHIRAQLVKQGIDLNRIYTVSKGKEQPIDARHVQEAWSKNRRAEFKIFEK